MSSYYHTASYFLRTVLCLSILTSATSCQKSPISLKADHEEKESSSSTNEKHLVPSALSIASGASQETPLPPTVVVSTLTSSNDPDKQREEVKASSATTTLRQGTAVNTDSQDRAQLTKLIRELCALNPMLSEAKRVEAQKTSERLIGEIVTVATNNNNVAYAAMTFLTRELIKKKQYDKLADWSSTHYLKNAIVAFAKQFPGCIVRALQKKEMLDTLFPFGNDASLLLSLLEHTKPGDTKAVSELMYPYLGQLAHIPVATQGLVLLAKKDATLAPIIKEALQKKQAELDNQQPAPMEFLADAIPAARTAIERSAHEADPFRKRALRALGEALGNIETIQKSQSSQTT